ncbi:precorrin-2 dehydrogenase/sirohydrochlorin ferrochelatase family protein [Leptotrichia buccalis]|uniref:precorrin-2 dehydrogenase n=1 Tax=Leptotrichia buccalis (strain ATCC 14201 / DSM 1135 / JCM 12969 / NCTC 10249 / C-1013-b) TaxID=523794 RepID=C7NCJ5_LEPBD|nr:bifunctional precorrin-2 dehydrogenase/sirohydrochlorin ferrochelatase [Leptotrichia buccalis]ACV39841.1 ferrochelatase [Leptotrichia buccalis C-1013-b]
MNMWFPLFVNLENKKILVIGGGKIAYKKITKILEYSANVTIVTEKIEEEKLLQLENVKIVDNKRIENDKDTIEELVKDYFLVIAATNDEELNENIAKICDSRGILINNISSKTEMNAMFGGIVKNDEFQIAVSTGGKNCRRSRAMKSEIQKILDKIEK